MTTTTGLPLPRTIDELRERLAEAARTLRQIPSPKHSAPGEMRTGWPDVVRSTAEAYGYDKARGGRTKASASAIGRMEETLAWIATAWSVRSCEVAGLPPDAGAVAWLRAAGWKWPRIAELRRQRFGARPGGGVSGIPGGNTPPSLRAIEERALGHMLAVLGVVARRTPEDAPAEEPGRLLAPGVRFEVVVDRAEEERILAMRDGRPVYAVSHARAEWREVPQRRR